jgi:hypothetical protein
MIVLPKKVRKRAESTALRFLPLTPTSASLVCISARSPIRESGKATIRLRRFRVSRFCS